MASEINTCPKNTRLVRYFFKLINIFVSRKDKPISFQKK
jgi:hypothetical protein